MVLKNECKVVVNEKAYQIKLTGLSGKEIIKATYGEDNRTWLEDHIISIYNNTHFDLLESDVVEEHYRYGIQTNNFIASGTYKSKPFKLHIEYKDNDINVEQIFGENFIYEDGAKVHGDFTKEEFEEIKDLGYSGENMMHIFKALDKIFRQQNPNTPESHVCLH